MLEEWNVDVLRQRWYLYTVLSMGDLMKLRKSGVASMRWLRQRIASLWGRKGMGTLALMRNGVDDKGLWQSQCINTDAVSPREWAQYEVLCIEQRAAFVALTVTASAFSPEDARLVGWRVATGLVGFWSSVVCCW